MASMVAEKLMSITQHTLKSFWHTSALNLFKYVTFERL